MHLPKYQLTSDESKHIFKFTSIGAKGKIEKAIHFEKTANENVVNLAFGDYNKETGNLNDKVVSANGDRDKILATICSAIYSYKNLFPDSVILLTGNTRARNRLYRMAINKFAAILNEDFQIYGSKNDQWVPFEKNIKFDGFIAKRNFLYL